MGWDFDQKRLYFVPQTCRITGDHNIILLYVEGNTIIYDAAVRPVDPFLVYIYLRLNNNNIPTQAPCQNITRRDVVK